MTNRQQLAVATLASALLLLQSISVSAEEGAPFAMEELDALDALDASTGDLSGLRMDSFKGFLAEEIRTYLTDRDRDKNDEQMLSEVRAELSIKWGASVGAFLAPRFIIDALDPDLHRYEPLEGYLSFSGESWDLRLGQLVDNLGIVDAYNPIDVINRRDLATDILDPVRLGELGMRVRKQFSSGRIIGQPALSLYALPVWRETRFPTQDNRFSLSQGDLQFRGDLGVEPSFADGMFGLIRFEHTLSTSIMNADVQYIYGRGPERMPALIPLPGVDGGADLVPVYYGVNVAGLGFRAVPNASGWSKLTFKLELAYKHPYEFSTMPMSTPDAHLQYVIGADRTFSGVLLPNDEIQLLVEFLGEVGADDPTVQLRPFRRDLAARAMWRVGDFARSTLELRGFVDVETGESVGEISAQRQLRFLHDDLSFEVSAQIFRPDRGEPGFLALFPNNSHLRTRLQLSF
jgi:hypothetical protein